MDNNKKFDEVFNKPIIKIGRATNLLAIITCLIPAFVIWLVYGEFPGVQAILKGWFLVVSAYGLIAIVEPISYFPVLGLSGTYMSFLAGNIGNMRLPCAAIAQDAIGTEVGSNKASLVSTLGIAGSIITNLIIVSIAAIGGEALRRMFPPVVLEGFNYVGPAIFGAIFGMNMVKNIKLGVFALIVGLVLILGIKILPMAIMIPINVFSTIALSYIFHKQNNKA